MSTGAKLNWARKSGQAQPMWFVHASPKRAPGRLDPILQLKGFAGGVPLNTETAAVKPRVGIESIAKGCLFYQKFMPGSWQTRNAPALQAG